MAKEFHVVIAGRGADNLSDACKYGLRQFKRTEFAKASSGHLRMTTDPRISSKAVWQDDLFDGGVFAEKCFYFRSRSGEWRRANQSMLGVRLSVSFTICLR